MKMFKPENYFSVIITTILYAPPSENTAANLIASEA